MSMNATDAGISASAILRATVDFPDPDPPAMPMMAGVIAQCGVESARTKGPDSQQEREARMVSRLCIVPEGGGKVNDDKRRVIGRWSLVVGPRHTCQIPTTNDQ